MVGSRSSGPREGSRPPEAGARTTGRGRLGHGPGRLWPCPRRPRVRGAEEHAREGDGSVEGPSPKRDLVTQMPGSPLFRAPSSGVTKTRGGLTTPWCGEYTQRVPGPRKRPSDGRKV